MNYSSIIVGAAVFLSIGLCHPAVIKMEYYWGKRSWWLWLFVGLTCVAAALFIDNQTVSTIISGFAFSCFWGIGEMFAQEKRVLRGWFPKIRSATTITKHCERRGRGNKAEKFEK